MKTYLCFSAATLLLALAGCTTTGTNAKIDAINETRKAIDRNTTANIAVGLGTVTQSTAPIEAAAVKIGESVVAADKHYEELRKELEAQKLEFNNFVAGALGVVGEAAAAFGPGGTAAAKVLGVIKARVETAQASANKAQQEGEAAKKDAATATTDAQKLVTSLKAELAVKEELQKKELEFARKELATLSAQQKEELHRELLTLAKANGVKGADGMSTEELLTALGASGLGLAGLLRTFGKSRSAAEVEKIASSQASHTEKIEKTDTDVNQMWDDLKKIGEKVAVLEHQTAADVVPTLRTDLAKITSQVDDHERRLGKIRA